VTHSSAKVPVFHSVKRTSFLSALLRVLKAASCHLLQYSSHGRFHLLCSPLAAINCCQVPQRLISFLAVVVWH
jgi:hypothetical protein